MAATYTIDTSNLHTMGFDVKEITGIYTVPERKTPTENDSPLISGVDGLHGANDYYVKERPIEIFCYLMVATVNEALTKLAALQALLYAPGTRTLAMSYSSETFVCYCADGAEVKRINKVIDNPIVYEVRIKLVEINPARFVI